jgi:hypothetical protein
MDAEDFPEETRNVTEQPELQALYKERIVASSLNYYDDPGDGTPPSPVLVGGYDAFMNFIFIN